MILVGHVTRLGWVEVRTGFWAGKPEGNRLFGRRRLRREDNIKMDLQEVGWWDNGLDWSGWGWRQVADCCECGNEPSSSLLSSSSPFTPYGAWGIHEELRSVAISSYPLDLTPWSSCVSYFILCCPSPRSVLPASSLYPWGFQSNAVFSTVPASLRNMCPIQFHFLLFIWISIDFCLVILHRSSFVILSVYSIFIIRLNHLFINVCNLLVIWLVVFQISQAYNNTGFTFVLNIRMLTPFDMLPFLHTGYSWTNTPIVFLILLPISSSVPPFTDTTLKRVLVCT